MSEWNCLLYALQFSDVNNFCKQYWLSFKQKSCFVCVSLQPQKFVFVNHRSTVSNKVHKVRRLHLLAYYFLRSQGVMHILFHRLLEECNANKLLNLKEKNVCWSLLTSCVLQFTIYDSFLIITKFEIIDDL